MTELLVPESWEEVWSFLTRFVLDVELCFCAMRADHPRDVLMMKMIIDINHGEMYPSFEPVMCSLIPQANLQSDILEQQAAIGKTHATRNPADVVIFFRGFGFIFHRIIGYVPKNSGWPHKEISERISRKVFFEEREEHLLVLHPPSGLAAHPKNAKSGDPSPKIETGKKCLNSSSSGDNGSSENNSSDISSERNTSDAGSDDYTKSSESTTSKKRQRTSTESIEGMSLSEHKISEGPQVSSGINASSSLSTGVSDILQK
jgi:hypothetical protein